MLFICVSSYLKKVILWLPLLFKAKHVRDVQEARALLGRYEYQKGNIVAALHVFEGIDIGVVTPKIKIALSRSRERRKKHSQNHAEPQMSIHSVGLLLESVFLKAKSLQILERFKGTPTAFMIHPS